MGHFIEAKMQTLRTFYVFQIHEIIIRREIDKYRGRCHAGIKPRSTRANQNTIYLHHGVKKK